MDETNFANWLEGARALRYADGVLTVWVSSELVRGWLDQILKADIEAAVSGLAGEPVAVRIVAGQQVLAAPG